MARQLPPHMTMLYGAPACLPSSPTRRRLVAILLAFALGSTACATARQPPMSAASIRPADEDERDQVGRLLLPLMVLAGIPAEPRCPIGLGVIESQRIGAAVARNVSCPRSFSLLVNEGALQRLPDAELRAMLAHELGHVRLGHFDRARARARVQERTTAVLRLLGGVMSVLPFVGPVASTALAAAPVVAPVGIDAGVKAFSRADEAEADRFAARLLVMAGGREGCLALVSLFERLATEDQGSGGWLSTHPAAGARAEQARATCLGEPR